MSFYVVDVPPGEGRRGRNHIHNVCTCTCTCTCTVSCKKTTSVYTHLLILKNNSVRALPLSTMGLGADRSCSKCIPSLAPNVWLGFGTFMTACVMTSILASWPGSARAASAVESSFVSRTGTGSRGETRCTLFGIRSLIDRRGQSMVDCSETLPVHSGMLSWSLCVGFSRLFLGACVIFFTLTHSS